MLKTTCYLFAHFLTFVRSFWTYYQHRITSPKSFVPPASLEIFSVHFSASQQLLYLWRHVFSSLASEHMNGFFSNLHFRDMCASRHTCALQLLWLLSSINPKSRCNCIWHMGMRCKSVAASLIQN